MTPNRFVLAGLVILVAGVALVVYGSAENGNGSAGGFILIGPFPIVFGSGKNSAKLALLSVLLGGVMLILLFLMSRRFITLTHEGREETDK